MLQIKRKVFALVVGLAFIAGGAFGVPMMDGDPTVARQSATWQIETDLNRTDLNTLVTSLDASCDVDVEVGGSGFTVAWACSD